MQSLNAGIVARTFISYFLGIIVIILFFFPCLLLLTFLPKRYRINNRLIFWLLGATYKGLIKAFLIPVHQIGTVPACYPRIIVANHQSALDIPLIGMLLQAKSHFWYALSYYQDAPVLGFLIKRLGVTINQQESAQAARGLLQGIRLIKRYQWDCVIFPEGGRHIDGTIHKFYRGFALIAKTTGLPVVPVMLHNAGKVYPPYSFWIYWYPITIRIGEPIWYTQEDTEELFVEKIRQWFINNNNA
jgi:1-acyl-sn-glycerol-3-phosphate acyltransferase